jgi:signal peptidase I
VMGSPPRTPKTPAASGKPPRAERKDPVPPPDGPLEWLKSLAIVVVLFFVIRTFLVQAFTIPSGSMEDTLLVGDYLMANNAVYGAQVPFTGLRTPAFREPGNGEVVVFRPTYNDPVIDVVKRVIGSPGDTLQMIDRVVYRNGAPLQEPYLEPDYLPDEPLDLAVPQVRTWQLRALVPGTDASSYRPTRDNWGPLIVPESHFFLMGDNRDQSLDSRYVGFVPREVIKGRAMFIYFSVDRSADRPFPRFLTGARWGRIGMLIR